MCFKISSTKNLQLNIEQILNDLLIDQYTILPVYYKVMYAAGYNKKHDNR